MIVACRNAIVVQPKSDRIVLHGVRDMKTLKELDPESFAKEHEWECVKMFSMSSLEEVIHACKTLNPIESGLRILDSTDVVE